MVPPKEIFEIIIDKFLSICKPRFSNDNTRRMRKGGICVIDYEPLWKTMKDRKITTYTLIYKNGFSPYTIYNLRQNKSITMNTLEKICDVLECTPNDVVRFVDPKQEEN